jgi:hypothetical protein
MDVADDFEGNMMGFRWRLDGNIDKLVFLESQQSWNDVGMNF